MLTKLLFQAIDFWVVFVSGATAWPCVTFKPLVTLSCDERRDQWNCQKTICHVLGLRTSAAGTAHLSVDRSHFLKRPICYQEKATRMLKPSPNCAGSICGVTEVLEERKVSELMLYFQNNKINKKGGWVVLAGGREKRGGIVDPSNFTLLPGKIC